MLRWPQCLAAAAPRDPMGNTTLPAAWLGLVCGRTTPNADRGLENALEPCVAPAMASAETRSTTATLFLTVNRSMAPADGRG